MDTTLDLCNFILKASEIKSDDALKKDTTKIQRIHNLHEVIHTNNDNQYKLLLLTHNIFTKAKFEIVVKSMPNP